MGLHLPLVRQSQLLGKMHEEKDLEKQEIKMERERESAQSIPSNTEALTFGSRTGTVTWGGGGVALEAYGEESEVCIFGARAGGQLPFSQCGVLLLCSW